MWYTTPRFSLIFTSAQAYGLVYTRRHLLNVETFDREIINNPSRLISWLSTQGHAMDGALCIAHEQCQSGRLVLPGHHDRYACFLEIQPQLGDLQTWFDYHLYYDSMGKQTHVYWYALDSMLYSPLVKQLGEKGFPIRGISTTPLLLRYASSISADKKGVIFLYQDDQGFHCCVYHNRMLISHFSHVCEKLDSVALQMGLQNLQQQVPLANYASIISCTPLVHALCLDLKLKSNPLNTAWDKKIAEKLSEDAQLSGGLIAREWHEFAA